MKKCYIAGKVTDLPIEVYTELFKKGAEAAADLGYQPVNPVELNHNHDKTYLAYMREDITELLKCSAVYALNNWHTSAGAKIEVKLALDLGIPVIFQ